MKKVLNTTLGMALLALGTQCEVSAQDTKWREVFYEDFGGNNANDDKYGDALDADYIGGSLKYSRLPYGERYCIVKTSDDNGNSWHPGSDHTYLDDNTRGYYMRLDPPNTAGNVAVYRQKLTGICEGVNFKFSSWFAILSPNDSDPKPTIAVGIFEDKEAKTLVSEEAYTKMELSKTPIPGMPSLNWENLSLQFKVGEGITEAYFIVTVYQPESNGCDFGIDDVKIEVEQPAIQVDHTPYIMGEPVTLTASFVNNGFFSDLSIVKYKWQYSSDGGATFSDIAGSENYYKNDNSCGYTIPSFKKEDNNGVYRVIIGESGTLDKPICSIQEDFIINETKNKKGVVLCQNEIKEVEGVTLNASKLKTGQEIAAGTEFTLIITVIEPKEVILPDTLLCVGSVVDGKTYDSPTEFEKVETIPSKVSDCDSITITQKYIITSATVKELPEVDICQGATYKTKKYTEDGRFKEVEDNGCIQFVEMVNVHSRYEYDRTYSICQGSDFAGETYNSAGSFNRTFTYQTEYGCDSIINATIDVTEKISVTLEDVELCEGTDAYTFDGEVYTAAGTYDLSETTTSVISGCDSMTSVRLIIHPRYSNRNNPIDTMICYDSKLFGTVYPEPTTAPILIRDPNTYTTIHGCDSIVYYNLEVLKIQLKLEISSDKNTVCKGEEVEIFVKDLKPANTPLTWTPDLGGSSATRKLFTPSEDMVCVVKARNDVAQCETTDTARVYVKESPVIVVDTLDDKNNIVTYSVTSGTEPFYVYLNKNQISMEPYGEVKNSPIGTHKLWVRDSSDCTSSTMFEIKPVPITPNAYITPNSDGINDTWTIENIDVYPLSRVRIFDRDGKVIGVYEPYDNANGFDGTYMGIPLPSTDYWYEIDLVESDQQFVGHFTLIR